MVGGTLEIRERDEPTDGPFQVPERTALSLRFEAPGDVIITKTNTGAPIIALAPCSQRSTAEVQCPGSETLRVDITTGRGDDSVSLTGMVDKGAVPTTVDGGADNDSLIGGPGPDVLSGDGRNGNGMLPTGTGSSLPNTGDDLLSGGAGNDTLFGNAGRDGLVGSPAAGEQDILDGGADDDLFELGTSLGADEVRGGTPDVLPLSASSGIHPRAGALGVTLPSRGDIVTYERRSFAAAGTAGVVTDMDSVADDGATGEGDKLTGVEGVVGTVRNDRITGDGRANLLIGRLGRDKLIAGAGDDVLDLQDGVQDDCPSAGTGTNTIRADLTDEQTFSQCTVNEPTSSKTGSNIFFIPVDETTVPARVGPRLRRRAGGVQVTLTCPRSPQARCAGTVAVGPLRGGRALGRRSYSVARGRSARVTVPVSAAGLARLVRARAAEVVLVERGRSKKGPKTVRAQRRL